MLYDPKWEQQPSLKGFTAWLEKQPAGRKYCYESNGTCAIARYLKSIGRTNVIVVGGGYFQTAEGLGVMDPAVERAVVGWPATYGAALERLRAAI